MWYETDNDVHMKAANHGNCVSPLSLHNDVIVVPKSNMFVPILKDGLLLNLIAVCKFYVDFS